MPVPPMPKINDIFWSAQGEGLNSGVSAIFIRLAGCSLRCPYCDTRGAWSGGRAMSAAGDRGGRGRPAGCRPRQRAWCSPAANPWSRTCMSWWRPCGAERYFVAVETNGLHFQDLPLDWWTVSPKDVAAYRVQPQLWERASEIKLLVTPALDLAVVKKIRAAHCPAPILLQPERHDRNSYRRAFDFFKACAQSGMPGVRLGLQLHTVYRIP